MDWDTAVDPDIDTICGIKDLGLDLDLLIILISPDMDKTGVGSMSILDISFYKIWCIYLEVYGEIGYSDLDLDFDLVLDPRIYPDIDQDLDPNLALDLDLCNIK